MKLTISGHSCHVATGGRPFNEGADTVIFIHGSGQSHLSWVLQTRYCAYDGYNVIAPDLPGHGLSDGEPLARIEDMADWVLELMDSLKIEQAHLVGHSQGGLVMLAAASKAPQRFRKLAFIATALAIPVNDFLIDASVNKPEVAIKMMTGWGHGPKAHMHDNTQPGFSHLGFGRNLMARNADTALHADLVACNQYDGGAEAASALAHDALVILAGADKMTPVKAGLKLVSALGSSSHVIIDGAGHMLPSESPGEVNHHLMAFLSA